MRLSLSVNGSHPVVASMPGPGYLSIHLNICDRPKENAHSIKIQISGIETAETETIRMSWPTADLNVGDILELRILPEGEGDPPLKVSKSSESPSNLFSSTELAREMLQVVSDFDNRVMDLVSKSEKMESADEQRKITRAVCAASYEMGLHRLGGEVRECDN